MVSRDFQAERVFGLNFDPLNGFRNGKEVLPGGVLTLRSSCSQRYRQGMEQDSAVTVTLAGRFAKAGTSR
jgi:hypothetical protein